MNLPEPSVNLKPVPWYLGTRFVLLMLFIFGPLALPLIWFSPKFSLAWKIGTTILAVVLTVLLGRATVALFQMLSQHLKDIQNVSVM